MYFRKCRNIEKSKEQKHFKSHTEEYLVTKFQKFGITILIHLYMCIYVYTHREFLTEFNVTFKFYILFYLLFMFCHFPMLSKVLLKNF